MIEIKIPKGTKEWQKKYLETTKAMIDFTYNSPYLSKKEKNKLIKEYARGK